MLGLIRKSAERNIKEAEATILTLKDEIVKLEDANLDTEKVRYMLLFMSLFSCFIFLNIVKRFLFVNFFSYSNIPIILFYFAWL